MIPADRVASRPASDGFRLAVLMQGLARGLQGLKNDALIRALRNIYPSMEIWDVDLHGVSRLAAQARNFHPDRIVWQSRFHAHPATFAKRTAVFEDLLERRGAGIDAFLQVGVLFDASAGTALGPLVIYTDHATLVTAATGRSFRLPFSEKLIARRIAQERHVLATAARICTRSRFIADAIASGYGISADRMSVVGGGGNVVAKPRPADGIAVRETFVEFLFVGRDFHRKGGDYVLRAFEKVHAILPNTRLTMVTSPKQPPSLPGVRWLSSPTTDELAEEYGAADVFVFPPRFDTWGDVLIEAMSAGLPCICPDRPPFDEIVSDGVTGLRVDVEDQAALSEAMLRIAVDRSLRRSFGKAGRAAALARFSWDLVAAKLARAIDEACGIPALTSTPSRTAIHE